MYFLAICSLRTVQSKLEWYIHGKVPYCLKRQVLFVKYTLGEECKVTLNYDVYRLSYDVGLRRSCVHGVI